MSRLAVVASQLWLIGALTSTQVLARDRLEEFDKTYAYCGSSAIFVGVATKVYFKERPDMDTCEDPAPNTVAQFANQSMVCYPLIVEVEVGFAGVSCDRKYGAATPQLAVHLLCQVHEGI